MENNLLCFGGKLTSCLREYESDLRRLSSERFHETLNGYRDAAYPRTIKLGKNAEFESEVRGKVNPGKPPNQLRNAERHRTSTSLEQRIPTSENKNTKKLNMLEK